MSPPWAREQGRSWPAVVQRGDDRCKRAPRASTKSPVWRGAAQAAGGTCEVLVAAGPLAATDHERHLRAPGVETADPGGSGTDDTTLPDACRVRTNDLAGPAVALAQAQTCAVKRS